MARSLDLEHGLNFYHFPCKEFINGRAIRKLEFWEEIKGNLVDPASSHMLVSKTNSFSRGQISGFGARMAIFTFSRVKNLSTAGPCAKLRFREETQGNLSHKWRMFIKDNHLRSSRPPRTEMSFPEKTGPAGAQAGQF